MFIFGRQLIVDDYIAEQTRQAPANIKFIRDTKTNLTVVEQLLKRSEGIKNSGSLLNSTVSWTIGNRTIPSTQPNKLSIPENLESNLDEWGYGWTDHFSEAGIATLDFSWMKSLASYNFWELDPKALAMANREKTIDQKLFLLVTKRVRPDFSKFQKWAILRMLRGIATGNPYDASNEVRQLSRLLASTETPEGLLMAVKILSLENQVIQSYGAVKVGINALVDNVKMKLISQLLLAQRQLFDPATPEKDFFEIVKGTESNIGACAALNEAVISSSLCAIVAEGEKPKEFSKITRALIESKCRATIAREAWKLHRLAKAYPLFTKGNKLLRLAGSITGFYGMSVFQNDFAEHFRNEIGSTH